MAVLPDELWRRILEIGTEAVGFTYKDLCCLAISSSRLRRLSDDDSLWSLLLASDFKPLDPQPHSSSFSSKSLYTLRFERERDKKIAAHRRALLRKESEAVEYSRKIRELESRLAEESYRARAALLELSNLRTARQASVALNVWQPEVVRGRHKEIVEQSVVPVEHRFRALEMELKLCNQRKLGFERAYKDMKLRLDRVNEDLHSMRYHPLRPNVDDDCPIPIKPKKRKRFSTGLCDDGISNDPTT